MWGGIQAGSNLVFQLVFMLLQPLPDWLAGALLGVGLAAVTCYVLAGSRWLLLRLAVGALLVVPLAVIQLETRHAWRPLAVGEHTTLRLHLAGSLVPTTTALEIVVPRGLALETPVLRRDDAGTVAWRLRAEQPGVHLVRFDVAGTRYTRRVVVGDSDGERLDPRSYPDTDPHVLLYPAEEALRGEAPLRSIEIEYTRASALPFSIPTIALLVAVGLTISIAFALVRRRAVA